MTVTPKPSAGSQLDLTPGQNYVVLGIEADDFRLLNDCGKPFLYGASLFRVVDSRKPDSWIHETGADGERYAYPRELNRPGFFEDFFDRREDALAAFWHVVNELLATPASSAAS